MIRVGKGGGLVDTFVFFCFQGCSWVMTRPTHRVRKFSTTSGSRSRDARYRRAASFYFRGEN